MFTDIRSPILFFLNSFSPGTMTPSLTTFLLLMVLFCTPVFCAEVPSPVRLVRKQLDVKDEDFPHPGNTARRPKVDPSKLIRVLDVPDNTDNEPDAEGEYSGASLNKPGMPKDFTICGAYMTKAWSRDPSAHLFQLNGKDGHEWGFVNIVSSRSDFPYVEGPLGNVFFKGHVNRYLFPLSWTLICMSLDTVSGNFSLVVDGWVLEDGVYQEALKEDKNQPSNLSIVLGYKTGRYGMVNQYSGQFSNINIFSSPLPTAKLVAMTQAGNAECGAPGDFLTW